MPSTWGQVSFVIWERSPDLDDLNGKLLLAGGPARVSEMDASFGCYACFVIHPPDWHFNPSDWEAVANLERNGEDISSDATFDEVREILRKWRKQDLEDAYHQREQEKKKKEKEERKLLAQLMRKYKVKRKK